MKKNLLYVLAGMIIGIAIYSAVTVYAENNKTIATVGEDKITQKDLSNELDKVGGKHVLLNLIDVQVIEKSAAAAKIKASDDEIKEELNNYKSQFSSDEEFNSYLDQQGIDEAELKEQVKTNVLFRKLSEKDVNITDEEIQSYYTENEANFIEPEQVHARHILVSTEEEAKSILADLKSGKDFAELAKTKSIDTASGAKGGDLGYFEKGVMDPDFEKVAFSLKKDEISEPVKTQFGYHIIQLQDHKAEKKLTLDEARADIENTLKQQKAKTADVLLPELRENVGVSVKDSRYSDVLESE